MATRNAVKIKEMDPREIAIAILTKMYPDLTATIRYKSGVSPQEVANLVGLANDRMIELDLTTINLIDRILETDDWGGDENRVLEFRVLHGFQPNTINNHLRGRVDHLHLE